MSNKYLHSSLKDSGFSESVINKNCTFFNEWLLWLFFIYCRLNFKLMLVVNHLHKKAVGSSMVTENFAVLGKVR